MWTVAQAFLQTLAAWLIESSSSGSTHGPLEAVYAGLYIAPTGTLGPLSTMANITEANYDGYTRQLVAWYPPYVSGAGPVQLEGMSLHFSPTDATVGNNITGVFLADAATGGNLLMSARWPGTGAPLGGPGQALTYDPIFQFQVVGGNYGGPDLSN